MHESAGFGKFASNVKSQNGIATDGSTCKLFIAIYREKENKLTNRRAISNLCIIKNLKICFPTKKFVYECTFLGILGASIKLFYYH